MPREAVRDRILELLGHEPTYGQKEAARMLSNYLHEREKCLFLLEGYAGTGKTSLVSALVRFLPEIRARSVLLAPTGRAAKVLSGYSGRKAFTIHKKIYRQHAAADGGIIITLERNPHKSTIFIVDEASMIPDNIPPEEYSMFSSRNLLDDLINYVYEGQNCRLILIGDSAQLPPVGLDISPALDLEYIKASYGLKIFAHELTEVVRQSRESGILDNATYIRKKINREDSELPIFLKAGRDDFIPVTGNDLEDILNTEFNNSNSEGTVIITRSNKRANVFNQEVRNRILYRDSELAAGDLMMVVRNNYYWLPQESKAGFIANGDQIELLRIGNKEELYGFRFANVTIRLVDYPEEKDMDVKIILDSIGAETPSLSQKDYRRLFEEIMKDYDEIPSRRKRIEKVRENPYFNALQVKFAYALTCHKTQGGQWENVFIDQGYLKEEMINKEYLRWLYTAVTRATGKVYLINFREYFFDGG